jgi:hypothetical protein
MNPIDRILDLEIEVAELSLISKAQADMIATLSAELRAQGEMITLLEFERSLRI